MAKAPKPWKLTEDETFSSFTSWQNNLMYVLGQDDCFKPFLVTDVSWSKLTSSNPTRGFTDDPAGTRNGLTAVQKAANLNQMLGLISQWVPPYLSNDITKNSTDLNSVWNFIRKYFGFQQSEAHFMKFSTIVWEEGERPERLYQRILAHLQDNLLTTGCKLKHDGVTVSQDEDISPTVERLAVLRWMELIHPNLPALVQRTFAYDLQRMTLKDLQPQIVDALDGFLEELRTDEVKVSRSNVSIPRSKYQSRFQQSRGQQRALPVKPECRLCRAEGRRYIGHRLDECDYITRAERKSLARSCTTDYPDPQTNDEEYMSESLDQCRISDE